MIGPYVSATRCCYDLVHVSPWHVCGMLLCCCKLLCVIVWAGVRAGWNELLCAQPFDVVCVRVCVFCREREQLSPNIADLRFEYFSKRLHGIKDWSVSFDKVGSVRSGLPLGYSAYVGSAS